MRSGKRRCWGFNVVVLVSTSHRKHHYTASHGISSRMRRESRVMQPDGRSEAVHYGLARAGFLAKVRGLDVSASFNRGGRILQIALRRLR